MSFRGIRETKSGRPVPGAAIHNSIHLYTIRSTYAQFDPPMHNSRYLYTIRAPAIHNSASATLDRACRYAIRHAARRAYSALRYCGNCPLNALGRGIRRRATVADESLRRLSAAPPRPHLTKPGHLYTIRACYTQFGSSYTQFAPAIHNSEAAIHNSRQLYTIRGSYTHYGGIYTQFAPAFAGAKRATPVA